MKTSDTTRQRFHNAKWIPLYALWGILVFALLPFAETAVIVGVLVLLMVSIERIVWWQMSLKENKLIKAQPNTLQRGYILQRLNLLSYRGSAQVPGNTQVYTARDLKHNTDLAIYRIPIAYIGVVYKIDFTQREFVGAASIGNQYRYTTERYVLSPSFAEVRYVKIVSFHESDAFEYAEQETTEKALDHLPDEIVERIEYAILHWQTLSLDAQ